MVGECREGFAARWTTAGRSRPSLKGFSSSALKQEPGTNLGIIIIIIIISRSFIMARILIQRGSSSNPSHRSSSASSSSSSASASATEPPPVTVYEETTDEVTVLEEQGECSDAKDVSSLPSDEPLDREEEEDEEGLIVSENAVVVVEGEGVDCDSPVSGGDDPDSPPLPVPPPPKPCSNRRSVLGSFGDLQIGAARRGVGSHPSSPRSQSENEGYNSSDEHAPSFTPSHAGSGSVKCYSFSEKYKFETVGFIFN